MNSIEKSIEILNYLSNAKRNVGITELSSKLLFPKSTVHRILNSLLNYSLVDKEKNTSQYRLGLQILRYSNSFYNSLDFRQIANPILKKVCIETSLTTFINLWLSDHGICIDSVTPSKDSNAIPLFVEVGREIPFYCTASSKVILANQPMVDIKRIISKEPLLRYTLNTITEPKKLIEHLLEIKNKGFAICDEEHQKGIKAIAAPIKDVKGKTIASLAIAGLAERMSSNNIGRLIKVVTNSAKEISKKLGYSKSIER